MTTKTSKNAVRCHECGAVMRRGARDVPYSYKGETIQVKQPGWYCTGCDEGVLDGADMAATESAFVDLKARVDGVLSPSQVRQIRQKLRLSQRKAGALLGGGPRAFQKYEKGTAMVSQPMSNLLRLLAKDPKRLRELDRATG